MVGRVSHLYVLLLIFIIRICAAGQTPSSRVIPDDQALC